MSEWAGRTVVVTGGGRGIGAAVAREMAGALGQPAGTAFPNGLPGWGLGGGTAGMALGLAFSTTLNVGLGNGRYGTFRM